MLKPMMMINRNNGMLHFSPISIYGMRICEVTFVNHKFLTLLPMIVWLRDLDIKKIAAVVFGDFRNVMLGENI